MRQVAIMTHCVDSYDTDKQGDTAEGLLIQWWKFRESIPEHTDAWLSPKRWEKLHKHKEEGMREGA